MKMIFLAASLMAALMMAALMPVAAAQDNFRPPQASLDRDLDLQPGDAENLIDHSHRAPGPPSYCKPCLFYAGDFDSDASDANGLANEVDLIDSTGSAVYTPFFVPKGKTWTVTGLFTNNFLFHATLDPATSPYEIRQGIPKAGDSGGKLVCHGRKPATLTIVIADYVSIYATKVEHIKGCRLSPGKYWMTVIPYCTNTHDSQCENGYRALLSNDDGAMAYRFGPLEPANNSFFNSKFYGAHWDPTSKWQSSARFSVGVEGTAK